MEERAKVLDLLHKTLVKDMHYPFFTIKSHQIQIFDSPVDFYLALCKGIRVSYKRIILSSLYIGDGPLERFLLDQLFNRLEVHKSLRCNILVDYNRGHRGKYFSSYALLKSLKANFNPNPNVRVGFYKPPVTNIFPGALYGARELQGVQHTKVAVFDDTVFLTGANMSENYFTERQDRYFLFKDHTKFADFCDDTVNSLIDCSYQMDDDARLVIPNNQPIIRGNLDKSSRSDFKEMIRNRIKMTKFLHNKEEHEKHQFKSPRDSAMEEKNEEKELAELVNKEKDWSSRFKKILTPEDVFNELKDMPHSLNVITGDGGWNSSQLTVTGEDVIIFPSIQLPQAGVNDDRLLIEALLPCFSELKIASGYMGFPNSFTPLLKQVKALELLCASPLANGFLGDGVKNWIPFMYRCLEKEIFGKLTNASLFEYQREGWTFHGKGIWASDKSGTYLTALGSSNFSRRSYLRDAEFMVYLWTDCPAFKKTLMIEQQKLWTHSYRVGRETFEQKQFKIGLGTKVLTKLLRSFL
ncbi:unnamed protein product [Blepharisma stoltei]|uniref:CDP-diacylglycerol--glycerol-3-phosphate 3-phosphatidyltransferase n=1 Tax=Blepharisma stoltei TaxID=1481888 RepID=A0AAU9ITB6_9CILI|nr:unnamed protein product [Blepharisma stoltei]